MRIRLHNYFEHPKGTGLWKRHSKNPSHAQTSRTSVVTDSTSPLFHKEKFDLVLLSPDPFLVSEWGLGMMEINKAVDILNLMKFQ